MKKYNYTNLDKPIQELMTILQTEYPNGFTLTIEPDFAKLTYHADDLVFESNRIKPVEGEPSPYLKGFFEGCFKPLMENLRKEGEELKFKEGH